MEITLTNPAWLGLASPLCPPRSTPAAATRACGESRAVPCCAVSCPCWAVPRLWPRCPRSSARSPAPPLPSAVPEANGRGDSNRVNQPGADLTPSAVGKHFLSLPFKDNTRFRPSVPARSSAGAEKKGPDPPRAEHRARSSARAVPAVPAHRGPTLSPTPRPADPRHWQIAGALGTQSLQSRADTTAVSLCKKWALPAVTVPQQHKKQHCDQAAMWYRRHSVRCCPAAVGMLCAAQQPAVSDQELGDGKGS